MIEHVTHDRRTTAVVAVTKVSLGFLHQDFQTSRIEEYAANRVGRVVGSINLSNEVSYDTHDLIDYLVSNQASKLVVWSLTVLSPLIFTAEDFLDLLAELERRGIDLVILDEEITFSAKGGTSIHRLRDLWDSFKRARKRENALASRAKAKERGHLVQRKRRANPTEIILLRSRGKTIKEISIHANVSESAVYRALQRVEQGAKKTSQ